MGPPFSEFLSSASAAYTAALLLSTAAFFHDIRTMKIPNYLILTGWLTGACLALFKRDTCFLISALLPVLLFFPFFLTKMIGAGDIKLLSAICGIIGYHNILYFLTCFLILAGILSVIQMLRTGILISRFRYFFRYMKSLRTLVETHSFRSLLTDNLIPSYRRPGLSDENLHLSLPVLLGILFLFGGS